MNVEWKSILNATAVFLLSLACALRMSARAGRGEIAGEVRDSSGGLVPGAKVTATQWSTNQETRAVTNASGLYIFTGLRPGLYAITAESTGFRRLVQERIQLSTGVRIRLDFNLVVGVHSEVVRVRLGAPSVVLGTAAFGSIVSASEPRVIQFALKLQF